MSDLPMGLPGQCGALLRLFDDHGDNPTTFVCDEAPGHQGAHQERHAHTPNKGPWNIMWTQDERPELEQLERDFLAWRTKNQIEALQRDIANGRYQCPGDADHQLRVLQDEDGSWTDQDEPMVICAECGEDAEWVN